MRRGESAVRGDAAQRSGVKPAVCSAYRRGALLLAAAGVGTWLCGCANLQGDVATEHDPDAAGDPPPDAADGAADDTTTGEAGAGDPGAETAAGPAAGPADAADADFWRRPRTLDLVRTQTGERIQICYWSDGDLLDAPYRRLCHLLRDVRASRQARIDPLLLDLMWAAHAIARQRGAESPLHVLSGFRTLATNRRSRGTAGSLHTAGRAVDCRLPGLTPLAFGRLVRELRLGGVGIYARRTGGGGWVHVDTGHPRTWTG
jgi:uncharacterized protein YcbK (DUF882 family)